MYNIAICEDEPVLLKVTAEITKASLAELGIDGEIASFSNGEALLNAFENNNSAFDLLLLDILMDGINGIELAQKLRARGVCAAIVFVTSSEQFLRDGYTVQPVNYLFKPANQAEMTAAIRTARRMHIKEQKIIFHVNTSMFVLEIPDILYIEVYGHELHIQTATGVKTASGTLASALELLPKDVFARCHNSYLVNLAYVDTISRTQAMLRGGFKIPVSRSYYNSFQTEFVNYLL